MLHQLLVLQVLQVLLHISSSEMHYAPVLRPVTDAPEDGNIVELHLVKMEDECTAMAPTHFCSNRELDELRGVSAVLCKSVMEATFTTGEPVGTQQVEEAIVPLGYDFLCTGEENNIDQCTATPVACYERVVVTCVKPGLFGTCNSPCGCPAPALLAKVVGGQDALPGEFPWQVTISADRYLCGGSLLDATHIVTAAHCVHNPSSKHTPCKAQPGNRPFKQCSWLETEFTIYYDTIHFYKRASSTQFKKAYAETVYIHKDYVRDRYILRHDIAIIKLDQPVAITEYVHPACLPDHWDNFVIPASHKVTVSGFGDTTPQRAGVFPDILQRADVNWLDLDSCKPIMYNLLKNEHFCAGDVTGEVDACKGDSGGPLVYRNEEGVSTLVGLVSFSYGCALQNHYSIYTDVEKELGFIRDVLTDTADPNTIRLACTRTACTRE